MSNQDLEQGIFEYKDRKANIASDLEKSLRELRSSRNLILVEGKRDKEALVEIGVEKERIVSTAHKSINDILEFLGQIKIKEVINLLDTDSEGKKRSAELYKNHSGIKINREFRSIIFKRIKSRRLEDLLNYLERNVIAYG